MADSDIILQCMSHAITSLLALWLRLGALMPRVEVPRKLQFAL